MTVTQKYMYHPYQMYRYTSTLGTCTFRSAPIIRKASKGADILSDTVTSRELVKQVPPSSQGLRLWGAPQSPRERRIMSENKKIINIRVTAAEKRKLESMAAYCGLSLSEYLRKSGLGFVPRTALGDDFYQCYYRLCDLCNLKLSPDVEAELLYLIDDIREELMLPGKRNKKEVLAWLQQASGPSRDN